MQHDTRTAIQRLGWEADHYTKNDLPRYAWLAPSGVRIADVVDCPNGWAVRFYCIPWNQPSATEIYHSHAACVAAVEDWVRGLDIDPGELPTAEDQLTGLGS